MSITDFSDNFSNKIKTSSNKLLSSSSRPSTEGLYKSISEKSAPLFTSKKSSSNRLLSIPSKSETVSSIKSLSRDSIPFSSEKNILDSGKDFMSTASSAVSVKPQGSMFFRYLSIFLIIALLIGNLFLYLIKPAKSSILEMYDPLLKLLGVKVEEKPKIPETSKKETKTANSEKGGIKKLEKAIDEKKTINKIDGKNIEINNTSNVEKPKMKKEFIPEPDDSTSRLQSSKPSSKQGYCYIGEDRGFRSCIEVDKGDVCMSGDIFPTKDICINPNLRE